MYDIAVTKLILSIYHMPSCPGLVASTYEVQQHKIHAAIEYIEEIEEKLKMYAEHDISQQRLTIERPKSLRMKLRRLTQDSSSSEHGSRRRSEESSSNNSTTEKSKHSARGDITDLRTIKSAESCHLEEGEDNSSTTH